uniref:PPIase cyclophilin-type domain-containing protein n=1 Tax=Oryza barthii TaxID=65489 RepID=A0A0D3EIT8_9ORYZ
MSHQILHTSNPTLPTPPQPHTHHPPVPPLPKLGRRAALAIAAAPAILSATPAPSRAQEAAAAAAAAPCIADLPLEVDQEQVGVVPNGTEFVITTGDAPELDASALVVGRVVDGMDVLGKIAAVPTVKDNTASPYFRVAKLIGDKRAVVAERGFNRPYTKILITNCGVIEQQQQ